MKWLSKTLFGFAPSCSASAIWPVKKKSSSKKYFFTVDYFNYSKKTFWKCSKTWPELFSYFQLLFRSPFDVTVLPILCHIQKTLLLGFSFLFQFVILFSIYTRKTNHYHYLIIKDHFRSIHVIKDNTFLSETI